MSDLAPDLERLVRANFSVKQTFVLPDGDLEFQVVHREDTGLAFKKVASELAGRGYYPELTGSAEDCVLMLVKSRPSTGRRSTLPTLFALFTVASLVVFAIFHALTYEQTAPSIPASVVFASFSVSVAALLGAHELGQRFVARRRGGGRASSYVIPGVPFVSSFLPSLGFLGSQREPAVNKDGLFDTVIAGPLAVFALAVLLYLVGDFTSVGSVQLVPGSYAYNATASVNLNAIQTAMDMVLGPLLPTAHSGQVLVSPAADASTVGFALAFIGLLPMLWYDGGFLSSLAWGEGPARLASFASTLALLVLDTPNYWALAIVVILLAGRPFKVKLLDEVSPLSKSRRWAFVGALVLAFLCIPFPHSIATLALP